jgi:hypothetical protein
MDELEPWGLLKSREFVREWLWRYLNHLRENPEDFNYYVQMGDYKPFPLDKAKKAVEILSKAKITDEDIEKTAFDVLRMSKHYETEEDLYTSQEFKSFIIQFIINKKLIPYM